MKEIDILGANRFETFSKTRVGCRGVVIQDGKLLVSREEVSDYWMLPGGGLEENETPAECCVREILEETGYIVEPGDLKSTVECIKLIQKNGKEEYQVHCRQRVLNLFNKDDKYREYLQLYNQLLESKNEDIAHNNYL